jgi:UPF0176 protein
LNISAYKFVALPDADALRTALLARSNALQLKGTILLAEEGINLFLAGLAPAVQAFVAQLQQDSRFADLSPKEMLVKVKREIIRMDHPAIRPAQGRAPAVSPAKLKLWLDAGMDDEGRPVMLLDTRNGFEVDEGTFEGAIDWRLGKFSDFPQALLAHRDELIDKTVVSFCTGGIRCEKAAIFMREHDLPNTYQLDGGILKYFEETGGAHYRGNCFVFDERRTVDVQLDPQPKPSCPA